MIRVVLAVALATALVGASLPTAERAERDRNAALATEELRSISTTAKALADGNDPAVNGARITIELRAPESRLTDGGRLVVAHDRLAWQPRKGSNRTIEPAVPIRAPRIVVTDRVRLRLSLVGADGEPAVRVERANVQDGSRNQTARALPSVSRGPGVSV